MKEFGERNTYNNFSFRERPTAEQTVRPDTRFFRKDEEERMTRINMIREEFAGMPVMPIIVVFEELPLYRQILLLRQEQLERLKEKEEKEPLTSALEGIGDFFSFIGNLLFAVGKPNSETPSA